MIYPKLKPKKDEKCPIHTQEKKYQWKWCDIEACEPENFVSIWSEDEKKTSMIKMHLPHGKNNPLKIALIMENPWQKKTHTHTHCIFCYSDESAYQQELWS